MFAKANSLSFSKDLGRRLENFVFNKLRRSFSEIFYFKDTSSECDFLIKQNEKIVQAVQVCWEINGIKNAMAETGAKEKVIITSNQEDKLDGIDLIPGNGFDIPDSKPEQHLNFTSSLFAQT